MSREKSVAKAESLQSLEPQREAVVEPAEESMVVVETRLTYDDRAARTLGLRAESRRIVAGD